MFREDLVPKKLFTRPDYFQMLVKLLPRGPIWRHWLAAVPDIWQDNTSELGEQYQDVISGTEYTDTIIADVDSLSTTFAVLLDIFATELERFEDRKLVLETEIIPGNSSELLPNWEEMMGLPDGCSPLASTEDERRARVQTKYTQGKSDASLIEITRHPDFFISYAAQLGYTITIGSGLAAFRVSVNRVGDRLNSAGAAHTWTVSGDWDAELQCIFDDLKPAHTLIVWI